MAAKTTSKYADYRYKITTPEELREAKWLVEQGDFKDLDDYLEKFTRVEIRRMRRRDSAERSAAGKKKIVINGTRTKAA
jgi:hypothetical protein